MQEKRVFLRDCIPAKHAQEAIFVIYNVFLHISNTDLDPQKSANHRAPPYPPPWLPQKKRLSISNAFRHHPTISQSDIYPNYSSCINKLDISISLTYIVTLW